MIVVDTHVWVWWISAPEELSEEARKTVDKAAAEDGIFVSSISVWEVALLVRKSRLKLTMDLHDWVTKSESLPFLNFVPVDNEIALRAIRLPGYPHKDPADRMIIATAISLGKALVTKDKRIRKYSRVPTIW